MTAWASQRALLQGIAEFECPDAILHEADLAQELPALAARAGLRAPPWAPAPEPHEAALAAIYDARIEAAVRSIYARDYARFGFEKAGCAWQFEVSGPSLGALDLTPWTFTEQERLAPWMHECFDQTPYRRAVAFNEAVWAVRRNLV